VLNQVDIDEGDLREKAVKYDSVYKTDALLRYLKTHGEVGDERLTECSHFQGLTAAYEG